jgi:cytochrome c-type biogenesis protein CcmH/NrfG
VEAAERLARRAPGDADAWERLGRLRLRGSDLSGALAALERARLIHPTLDGLLDLALVHHLLGDVGGEVSAAEHATRLHPDVSAAWSRYAHALARTERRGDCLAACERALDLSQDPEVSDLRDWVREQVPREIAADAADAAA